MPSRQPQCSATIGAFPKLDYTSRDTGLVIERMRLAIPSHFLSRFSFASFACSFREIPWCCMYNNTQDTSEGQLRVT
jgi:hypothetical protein